MLQALPVLSSRPASDIIIMFQKHLINTWASPNLFFFFAFIFSFFFVLKLLSHCFFYTGSVLPSPLSFSLSLFVSLHHAVKGNVFLSVNAFYACVWLLMYVCVCDVSVNVCVSGWVGGWIRMCGKMRMCLSTRLCHLKK